MNSDRFTSWAEDIIAYANDHYEEDGWDYIIESFGVDDVVDLISWCTSYDEALFVVATHARIYDERRTEVQSQI
jgi:hypothetical protein